MDIKDQIQPIVASLVENLQVSIEQEVRDSISQEIVNRVASAELSQIIDQVITDQLSVRLKKYNIEATTETKLASIVNQLTQQIEKSLATAANKQITEDINRKLAQLDITSAIANLVEKKLGDTIAVGNFPPNSIPHTSVNFRECKFSGSQIRGGIIENFGSTGIEDRATKVNLTLLDHASVFENTVFAPKLEVKGDLTVDGLVTLKGDIATDSPAFDTLVAHSTVKVKEQLNEELFRGFSNTIHKNLLEQGVDLDRITQGGKEVIKGPQLGYHIVDSNLQRVGVLRDLQTTGENLLCNTLYVTEGRAGVNTMDPSATFVVWDEEVEMIVAKRKQDTGYIGTSRYQRIILGSNNKENITLNTDGSVEIEELSIGNIPMTSAAVTPNYEGRTGQIVWNESPSAGGAVGWVCLGATQWAKFGIIE